MKENPSGNGLNSQNRNSSCRGSTEAVCGGAAADGGRMWEEMQARLEQVAGEAGLRIIGAILEEEVRQRVGPSHRPETESGAVRWGHQPGYVVFSRTQGGDRATAGAPAAWPR